MYIIIRRRKVTSTDAKGRAARNIRSMKYIINKIIACINVEMMS